jgi:hypothetical protein
MTALSALAAIQIQTGALDASAPFAKTVILKSYPFVTDATSSYAFIVKIWVIRAEGAMECSAQIAEIFPKPMTVATSSTAIPACPTLRSAVFASNVCFVAAIFLDAPNACPGTETSA